VSALRGTDAWQKLSAGKPICIDSNVAVRWMFREPGYEHAEEFLKAYVAGSMTFVVPEHFHLECASAAYHKALSGVPSDKVALALVQLGGVGVVTWPIVDLMTRLVEIAMLAEVTAWDAAYVAVAELVGCEFWTADAQLVRRASVHFPFVRHLGADSF